MTDARLTSTEQVLAGGYRSVRGFDENLVRSDSGMIVNAELISPPFDPLKPLLPENLSGQWSFLAFYDGAYLDSSDTEAGTPNPSLQSAGIGILLKLEKAIQATAAYGWNIATHGIPDEALKGGRLHFGVTARY